MAAADLLEISHNGILALGMLATRKAGEAAGLDQTALGLHGLLPVDAGDDTILLVLQLLVQRVIVAQNDGDDGQVVLLGELEVTLVAARNGHDRAGAVVGHDVVGNPHGDLLAVDRVHNVTAGERTMLFLVALSTLDRGDLLGVLDNLHDGFFVLRALDQIGKDLAFRGKQEEAATEQRVGTRGEHGDQLIFSGLLRNGTVGVAQGERDLSAFGSADPIGLLLLDALGPTLKLIEVVQKFLCVIGDLEVPLRKIALLDLAVATPAAALGDLFVGKNSAAAGAPIHRRVAALDQTALPELLENPLAPAIILGIASNNGAVPVVREAHALEAGLLRLDIGVRPLCGMAVMFDSRVLGRKAERVPAHGMKHVETLHAAIARNDVADGVVADMTHVNVARRVREHLEDVLFRTVVALTHLVDARLFPRLLPTRLDLVRIVSFHVISCLSRRAAKSKFVFRNPCSAQFADLPLSNVPIIVRIAPDAP